MTKGGHLWAIGYDDMGRAEQVRQEIVKLGDQHCLVVLDTAVVVRHFDGTVTLDGERWMPRINFSGHAFAKFLAGLALGAPPLTGAAAGTLLSSTEYTAAEVGIDDAFVREVERLMQPGTSALFVLDQADKLEAILERIRGLGGAVLKTNVDVERARLIQATLADT
jgi:uncharacterized membrane protein